MTADTLSAEELYSLLWPHIGSDRVADECAQAILALIEDRIPSAELVALGEAAVRECSAKQAYEGLDSVNRWCALDQAGDALFKAARAYAASVAEVKHG